MTVPGTVPVRPDGVVPALPRGGLKPMTAVPPAAPVIASAFTSATGDSIASWVNEGGAGGEVNRFRALRIMVVEDEPTIAMLLSEVLQSMGHVVCAVEAREAGAVAAAARCKPDLMLVDARLKHGSGLLAVERILRTGFVPHVFVSGDRLEDRGLGAGAVILQKPYREADLKQAMQRAMLAAVA